MPVRSSFFDIFPKIDYDVKRVNGSHPETVPNIFFRLGYLKSTLAQASAYDKYRVDDGDTPEILADKLYGDAGAGWMILYANKIFDPQFDWPLTSDQFEAYIIGKYGTVAKAQQQVHHVEKTVTRENVTTGESYVETYNVSLKRYSDNKPNVPFDYWSWNSEPTLQPGNGTLRVTADTGDKGADNEEVDVTADIDIVLQDGRLAQRAFGRQYVIANEIYKETIEGKAVSYYDYEHDLNEEKKFVRIIKKIYYPQIMSEFKSLTGADIPGFSRMRRSS